jgi:4-aminobutyrate aminotransferase-like enzyme
LRRFSLAKTLDGFIAGLANLRFMIKQKKKLFAHANAISASFQERLSQIKFKQRAAARVKGLALAVERKDSSYAERVASRCRDSGLLITTQDNALTLFSPLNTERQVTEKGLDILQRCA